MICAKPRPTTAPFDVRHRHILFYTLDSPSDFRKLQAEVTARLKAQLKKAETVRTVESLSQVNADDGLSSYEVAAMVLIMESRLTPGDGISPHGLRDDMRKAGYTDIATSLSLESLTRKGLIEYTESNANNFGETYTVCALTSRGLDWVLTNKSKFKILRRNDGPELSDDDIPF
jgi:hypothetical protein